MNGEMNGGTNGHLSGHMSDGDVKRWLDRALADEPPLHIDRTEILRQGRRKLRNRKLFQAGGAVAGVVAVVVGAVLVTGLVNNERSLPPAASQPETSPVSTNTSASESVDRPAQPTRVPQSTDYPPTSVQAPSAEVDRQAALLTAVLTRPGVLPSGNVLNPVVGARVPQFQVIHPNVYGLEADLTTSDGMGWLWVLVEKGPGVGANCDVLPQPVKKCAVRKEFGMPMTIGTQEFRTGEVQRIVRSVRPDGCFVTVTSSNLTSERRQKGLPPWPSVEPALSEPQMIKIAALADMYLK
jgi:hypothetical protein